MFAVQMVASAIAQEELFVSANFKNTALAAALQEWEKAYGLSFSFDDAAVQDKFVTCVFKKKPLAEALQTLLAGTGLDFETLDRRYVLLKWKPGRELTLDSGPPPLSLCGSILDGETGEPLPGAIAYIPNSPNGTATDEKGGFTLNGRFTQKDSLKISYLGYEVQTVAVADLLNKPCQSFPMKFAENLMPDIIIRDFATDMVQLGSDGSFHFKKDKIPTMPGWGEPDVMRILQLLPGIGSADETPARLNVRGGTPDQNLVLWEGIPIYHTGHFFGLYDAFNSYAVDEVDVWRGNFGSQYGGRNSSVIDIRANSEPVEQIRWGAGMNLLSVQTFFEAPLFKKKYSLRVSNRRSYVDGLQSTAYQNFFNQAFQNGKIALQEGEKGGSVIWQPTVSFGDANLKLNWQGRRKGRHAISFYYSNDHLDYRFSRDDSTYYTETRDLIDAENVGLSWQHQADWSRNFHIRYKVAVSAFSNHYTLQYNDGDRERPFTYRWNTDNEMADFSAQFHHQWNVGKKHALAAGYQLSVQEAMIVYRDTNAVKQEAHIWSNDTARTGLHTLYAEYNFRPGDKLDLTFGLRENFFPTRSLHYPEPRLNVNWRPFYGNKGRLDGDGFLVKGSLGSYYQFVFQIIDYGDLGAGEPLWAVAGKDIPAQQLAQLTLGAAYETKSLLVDGEFYLKGSTNLTSLNLRVDKGFERPLAFNGESAAAGFDFLIRKRLPPYSVWLSYSLAGVRQQFPELNGGQPYPARHDIRHRLNWVNMLALKRWDFAANLALRSGSPYSRPSVVGASCPECTADSTTYALDFDQLNNLRLPGSVRVDVSATYKWSKKRSRGKAGLAIYNLLNRKNFLDKDFLLETPPLDEPQDSYQLQELGRLAARITPSFFVLVEWGGGR
ncbi:MAG: TonB-dependent receptor [Saprospiraceae bacterium]